MNKIIKPKKFDNFTIIPSTIFRQKNISMGATGLYCWLFSHQSDFEMSVEYITRHFREGRDGVNSKVNELVVFGYLERIKMRKKGKFYGYNYILSEKPIKKPNTDKPKTEKPNTDKPSTVLPKSGNPQQSNINTNISVITKSNINKSNVQDSNFSDKVKESLDYFIDLFPDRFKPKGENQKINWLQTLSRLEKLDGYDVRRVYYIVKKVREDDFWRDNFFSIHKLRDKNKNGIKYIDYFAEKFGKNIF